MRSAFIKKTLTTCLGVAALALSAQAQFTSVDINNPPPSPGSTVTNGTGSYTIVAGGTEFWGDTDQGHFAYYSQAGDFDVRVRVQSVTAANRWGKAGIRLAEDLDPQTEAIFAYTQPPAVAAPDGSGDGANFTATGWRTKVDTGNGAQGGNNEIRIAGVDAAPPNEWLRMTRAGNIVTTYRGATNGASWATIATFNMDSPTPVNQAFAHPIPSTALLGLAHSSHNNGVLGTAEFRDFGSPSNAIAVSGNPVAVSVPAGAAASFSVTVAGGNDFSTFQWRADGVPVLGATSSSYTTPATAVSDNGKVYSVVVSNTINASTATSAGAVLGVFDYPVLVSADNLGNPVGVTVTYSKDVAAASALNIANYSIPGLTISAAQFGPNSRIVRLTTSAQSENSSYTLAVQGVFDTAVPANAIVPNPSSAVIAPLSAGVTAVSIVQKRYMNISGVLLANMYANANYPNNPTDSSYNPLFELTPVNGADNYGATVSGTFVAPVTGNYQFYISADDQGALFLSTDINPANLVQIAAEPVWNGSREFIAGSNQGSRGAPAANISALIPMTAGQARFMEARVKEGGGGDNLSVAVQYPGSTPPTVANGSSPIPSSLFRPFFRTKNGFTFTNFGPVVVISSPTSITTNERSSVTLSVVVDGTPGYAVTWFSNNVAIPGATGLSYTFDAIRFANGASYYARVANGFSSADSAPATLTVINDVASPTLFSASGSGVFTNVTVTFNEPADAASGVQASNYAITNSAGVSLAVLSASLRDGSNVVLMTAAQTPGQRYTVIVNNVGDRAGVANTIAPNSTIAFSAWVFSPGFSYMEIYPTGGGTDVASLRNHPSYPFYPSERYYIKSLNTREVYPNDTHDNYGGRLSGLFVPPVADVTVYISSDDASQLYASVDENPANVGLVVEETACCTPFSAHQAPLSGLVPGNRYYYQMLWKEGGGGDYAQVSVDGVNPVPAQFIGVYADPSAINFSIAQQPQNTTRAVNQLGVFTVNAVVLSLDGAVRPIGYQWRSNGVDIVGATGSSFTTPPLALANSGDIYSVLVSTPGGTILSSNATLNVIVDDVGPVLMSALGDSSLRQIKLNWSEVVDEGPAIELTNYILKDPSSNVVTIDSVTYQGSNIVLNFNTPLLDGVYYSLEIAFQFDLVGNLTLPVGSPEVDPNGVVTTVRTFVISRGFTQFQAYQNLPGGATVASFVALPVYPNSPTFGFITNVVNWPQTANPNVENYAMRFSGLFLASEDGIHQFNPAHDDGMRLRISSDTSPANASANELSAGCCSGLGDGPTLNVTMVAGNSYYFELIVVENGGGDYAGVAVQTPSGLVSSPIGAAYLALSVDPAIGDLNNIGIDQQPQSITIAENQTATFSLSVTNAGSGGVSYQWQLSTGSGFSNIVGAAASSYTTPIRTLANSGNQYRALVYVLGKTLTSTAATLTVVNDLAKPLVQSARSTRKLNAVVVRFDEPIGVGTAEELTNYTLTDTNLDGVAITSAVLGADLRTVTLQTADQGVGAFYTLHVESIQDLVGNTLNPTNLTFQTWINSRGFAIADYYFNIGGGTVADLTNNPAYPDSPSLTEYVSLLEQRTGFAENYGTHITAQLLPPVTGNYSFFMSSDDGGAVYISTDSSPANRYLIASEPGWNGVREWIAGSNQGSRGTPPSNMSSTLFPTGIPLAAGNTYYVEMFEKEGGGGDNGAVTWQFPTSPTVVNGTSPIQGTFMSSLADPVGASITISLQPGPTTTNLVNGQVATFTVAAAGTNANGNAPIVYQWQKRIGSTWNDIRGANGVSYTTPPTAAGSTIGYRALVFIPGAQTATAVATVVGWLGIVWTDPGVLQGADEITGPWVTIQGASSPYILDTQVAPKKFYRLLPTP